MSNSKYNIQELEAEYKRTKSLCDAYCTEVTRQLVKIFDENNIKLATPIQCRTKEWSSILDKISQGRYTIKKSVLELQDLVGIRLILLFKSDVNFVTKLVSNNFNIIRRYNTEDNLEENQFGYLSIHQIVYLKDEWLNIPTFKDFKGLKCEIQIRTLAQHAWAEASNEFQYKNENNVPKPLKRSIGRVSALLETVDLEFERILEERKIYILDIQTQKNNIQATSELNVDLLKERLFSKTFAKNRVIDGDYSELLKELQSVNVRNVHELDEFVEEMKESVLAREAAICGKMFVSFKEEGLLYAKIGEIPYMADETDVDSIGNGIYFTVIGFIRQMIKLKRK